MHACMHKQHTYSTNITWHCALCASTLHRHFIIIISLVPLFLFFFASVVTFAHSFSFAYCIRSFVRLLANRVVLFQVKNRIDCMQWQAANPCTISRFDICFACPCVHGAGLLCYLLRKLLWEHETAKMNFETKYKISTHIPLVWYSVQ